MSMRSREDALAHSVLVSDAVNIETEAPLVLTTGADQVTDAPDLNARPASRQRERKYIDALWLICLLGIVAAKAIRPALALDEDLWWHIRTGDWILKHAAVPIHDAFSHALVGKPYIAYTWLFDVLVSKVYNAWGLHGILTLTTFLTVSFVAALVFLFSRYGRMLRAIALAALVFSASSAIVTPRPWLFTCIFFVFELYLLLQARERGRAAWLLPLVPLFILWANTHIQFVYGLGVIGIFCLEAPLAALLKWPSTAKLRSWWYWAILGASTLGTLLNPYGWRLYTVVVQYATEKVALQVINEMQAMQFRNVSDWAALFLVCCALFIIGSSRKKCPLMMSLLVVSLWFGFRTSRDVWFLAIASALVIAQSSGPVEAGLRKVRRAQWAIALPISAALAFAVLSSAGVSPKALQEAASKRFPVQASAYIESHHLPGPLYNPYGWGGYLIWRLPKMPVSIDGRADLYGDKALSRYVKTYLGARGWDSDPELMKANTILLGRDCALASILRVDPRFRMVYDDKVASVFERLRQPAAVQ